MTIGLTYPELKALSPCESALKDVAGKLGGAKKWGKTTDHSPTGQGRWLFL